MTSEPTLTGLIVLIAAVVVAVVFGTYRLISDGRFSGTHAIRHAERHAARGRHDAAHPDSHAAHPDGTPPAGTPASRADPLLGGTEWADQIGERATLVQFSTAFCAPCRVARRTLGEVAAVVPGVVHIEIDAEHHLDLVRRLGIMRTPTTVVLDGAGHEVQRASGAPSKAQVITALDAALAD
ncbi:thioredoxin family protein [Nocardioides cavernaquae]|uniref:Thioredoxin n=1 Tax=Nocardioides cavernaquae TaxID=2321396 RepID=A0A3A5HBT4_9ACTN|nr:thioredoxin family protein [Nocardioides cavernaquae]RJS45437.1 thioredoxin [Nocardioides cavernaquae]